MARVCDSGDTALLVDARLIVVACAAGHREARPGATEEEAHVSNDLLKHQMDIGMPVLGSGAS